METTAYNRKTELAFLGKVCRAVFTLSVCLVISVYDMIPHTRHGKILSYAIRFLGKEAECYFNHHSTERFGVFESDGIERSVSNDVPSVLFAETDCRAPKSILPESHIKRKPYTSGRIASVAVGSVRLRAPPAV